MRNSGFKLLLKVATPGPIEFFYILNCINWSSDQRTLNNNPPLAFASF